VSTIFSLIIFKTGFYSLLFSIRRNITSS